MSTVLLRYRLYDQYGRQLAPFVPDLEYTDSETTGYNKVIIAGSASNATVPITDLGTISLLDLAVSADDRDKITVKYNGSTKAYGVSPREVTSENITGITASNSSTSPVNLYWRAVFA